MTAFATEGHEPAALSAQLSPTTGYYIRKLLRQQGVASPIDPTADLASLLRRCYRGEQLQEAIASLERLTQYHKVLSSQGSQHSAELRQAERDIIEILDPPEQPASAPASPAPSVPASPTQADSSASQKNIGAAVASAGSPLVLYVREGEDDRSRTEPLAVLATTRGYRIQSLRYSKEKPELRQWLPASLRPDAVVLELKMSESGIEICRLLRQQAEFKSTPIIMASGLHSVSDRLKALQLGVNDYLIQPVQPEEILIRLENHLRIQQRQKRLEQRIQQLQAQLLETQDGASPLLAQAVLDQHGDYLLFINRENKIVHVNTAASERLGYSRSELLSFSMDMLDVRLAPQDWQTIWEHLQAHQTLSLNSAHVTKAGETLDVQLDLQYLQVNNEAFSYLCAKAA